MSKLSNKEPDSRVVWIIITFIFLLICAQFLFIAFKLLGVINWPWLIVWVPTISIVVITAFISFVLAIIALTVME